MMINLISNRAELLFNSNYPPECDTSINPLRYLPSLLFFLPTTTPCSSPSSLPSPLSPLSPSSNTLMFRTRYSAKVFQNVGLAVLGAWVFLGFGTDAATFQHWILVSLRFSSLILTFFCSSALPPLLLCLGFLSLFSPHIGFVLPTLDSCIFFISSLFLSLFSPSSLLSSPIVIFYIIFFYF